MLTEFYRKFIPLSLRSKIYDAFLGRLLLFKRNFKENAKSKFIFLFHWLLPKTEKNKVYAYMGRYGLTSYPYKYAREYKNIEIAIKYDLDRKLPFVVHNGKKLFFPEFYDAKKITKDYRNLLIEQDIRSAHRYVRSYDELKDKILLDIGSAEGIFALDTIELVSHAYLFEYEDYWFASLEATFAPWKNKVTLVKKFVGEQTNETNTTIDDFLKDKNKDNLFLKMDIEGAEQSALSGSLNTLRSGRNIKLAVCTYHKKEDPGIISNLMSSLGYSFEFTEGFMYWQKRLSKGIIRCHN